MTTVLDAQACRQLQLAESGPGVGCGGLGRALKLAVEAPVADQAAIWTPPQQQVEKIDRAEVRSSQGLLFIARRARKTRVRHGSNSPKIDLIRSKPRDYEGNLSWITFVRK